MATPKGLVPLVYARKALVLFRNEFNLSKIVNTFNILTAHQLPKKSTSQMMNFRQLVSNI